MLITPHAATGAAIAVLLPNPVISIPLAIASHFVLDMVPHWQETLYPYKPNKVTWIRIPIDLSLAVVLVYLVTQFHPNIAFVIWLTAFISNIPDFDSIASLIPELFRSRLFKNYWDWHAKIQRETGSYLGLVSQVIITLVGLIISLV
ncbi:MAG: hypothetical protein V1808_00775 [Candidatus Daviesbacteria bacterium]